MNARLDMLPARAALYVRARPSREYLDYIRGNGLAPPSLGAPDPIPAACGCIVVTGIVRQGRDRFVFADLGEGEPAAVIEAFGRDGRRTQDLVAWPIDRPAQVLTMFGRVSMLGSTNIVNAASYAFGPLRVWRTPLRWLQEGGRGVVVVDPPAAAHDLLDATERGFVAGEDAQHSRQLADLVSRLFDRRRFVVPLPLNSKEAA